MSTPQLRETAEPPERLINVRQTAELLGVSTKTIYRYIRTGEIPSIRVGRAVRIQPSAITDWMAQA